MTHARAISAARPDVRTVGAVLIDWWCGAPRPGDGREISVGSVPVFAQRITFVGELGWELYCPTEFGQTLWDLLWDAGREQGLRAGGYRASTRLRLEKGYRVWGLDVTPETTPDQAGLGFAVRIGQAGRLHRPRRAARPARGGRPGAEAALPRARRPAGGLPRRRARERGRRALRPRDLRRLRAPRGREHRLRAPPRRRRGRRSRRGRRCSASRSAPRSRASRATTRTTSASGSEGRGEAEQLAALCLRISGRTSSRMASLAKSASQRSGVINGKSEPNSTLSFSSVFAYCTRFGGKYFGDQPERSM